MKHAKEEQLNNEGFSLVELLIAIVILSIIVVPLLHSFVTSARTNAKSRNTMHATAIAEDVMEQFEAHTFRGNGRYLRSSECGRLYQYGKTRRRYRQRW